MLAIPIPPTVTGHGGGTDPVVGVVALGVVLALSVWAYVASTRGRGRVSRPTGVTRLSPSPVHWAAGAGILAASASLMWGPEFGVPGANATIRQRLQPLTPRGG